MLPLGVAVYSPKLDAATEKGWSSRGACWLVHAHATNRWAHLKVNEPRTQGWKREGNHGHCRLRVSAKIDNEWFRPATSKWVTCRLLSDWWARCDPGRCFHQRLPSTRWHVTRHPSVPQAEKGCEWPENGGEWSDEDGANIDCGLLQAMAEEDEEINVYNEETFGMGVCLN